MFHLLIKQVVGFTSKMSETHLWKSDILSKDELLFSMIRVILKVLNGNKIFINSNGEVN